MPELKTRLVTNEFQRTTKDGKDFLIVPGVILQEQVMNNYFVPSDEAQKSLSGWNDRPIVIQHPKANNGSACVPNPDVTTIGRFYNAKWDTNTNRLSGEYWIDVTEANKTMEGQTVLSAIYANHPLETSTGYFATEDMTPGVLNGKNYDMIHRNLIPDHVAILPDKVGACSVKDGCGFNVNCQSECPCKTKVNVLGKSRSPSYEGTETTSWEAVTKTIQSYVDGCEKRMGVKDTPKNVADMSAEVKKWIASKTLLGDPSADNERDLMMFPVVNPTTNKLNAGALRAVLSGRGSSANIPASARDSAQNTARNLLEREFHAKGAKNMKLPEFLKFLEPKGIKATVNEADEIEVESAPELKPEPLFSAEEVTGLKALLASAPAIQNALKDIPAAVQMAQNAQTQAEAQKNDLIATIKANQANQYTEDELKSMSQAVLVKVNAQLNTSFVGAGGGRTITNDDKPLVPPSILLAKKEA